MSKHDDDLIVLQDENGEEISFRILFDSLFVGDRQYVVLMPVQEEDDMEPEIVILRLDVDENGENILLTIDSDEEWEEVLKAFEEIELEGEYEDYEFVLDEDEDDSEYEDEEEEEEEDPEY
ncbi:MAG TPA: DUF1292 domain-containing protein [Firmicutes bacterium]|nr:DUF1292 domain-containing protein [Candidatus Fermentithermobacillaceae bacterium]